MSPKFKGFRGSLLSTIEYIDALSLVAIDNEDIAMLIAFIENLTVIRKLVELSNVRTAD